MTVPILVPKLPVARSIFINVLSTIRRSLRWRPACDNRCACPNSSVISSTMSVSCPERPACDNGGSAPFAALFRIRCWRCRSRSSACAFAKSAARRARSCLARRCNRHFLLHVFCVFAVDRAGRYQRRHSQHRRRTRATGIWFIPICSQAIKTAANFVTPYFGVDLVTADEWISE